MRREAASRECRAIFAVLSDFIDGALDVGRCRTLRRHIRGCKPCLEYLESLKWTIRLCQLYQTGPAPPLPASVRKAFTRTLSQSPLRHSSSR